MKSEQSYIVSIFKRKPSVEINTLSPNKKFYYKFQEPCDLYWGLFCCKIAFYNIDNELIYHNPGQYAQCGIDGTNEWTFIFYSNSGNIAFFVERNSTKSLAHVFIDLQNKKVFRKDFTNEIESKHILDKFAKHNFLDTEALQFISNNFQDIEKSELEFEFKNIIGQTSWRP